MHFSYILSKQGASSILIIPAGMAPHELVVAVLDRDGGGLGHLGAGIAEAELVDLEGGGGAECGVHM